MSEFIPSLGVLNKAMQGIRQNKESIKGFGFKVSNGAVLLISALKEVQETLPMLEVKQKFRRKWLDWSGSKWKLSLT